MGWANSWADSRIDVTGRHGEGKTGSDCMAAELLSCHETSDIDGGHGCTAPWVHKVPLDVPFTIVNFISCEFHLNLQ